LLEYLFQNLKFTLFLDINSICQLHILLSRTAQISLELHFCVELHTKQSPVLRSLEERYVQLGVGGVEYNDRLVVGQSFDNEISTIGLTDRFTHGTHGTSVLLAMVQRQAQSLDGRTAGQGNPDEPRHLGDRHRVEGDVEGPEQWPGLGRQGGAEFVGVSE